ncbi:hypothetical protein CHS0354_042274 [Potamilus streckersoni]|uniref:Peptidase S1 domain-containing protein n=1 Tax=Potamilus streckersoni TaxID=2493646 RepID=A0AAE0W1F5_9BIVA|nr:hypothetical protein CHS0354_042274 [Potamilus streckersoni]
MVAWLGRYPCDTFSLIRGNGTDNLHKANVQLLSNDVCTNMMGRPIPDTEVFAELQHGRVGTCQVIQECHDPRPEGESGGHLVCFKNGVWKVTGIVSLGYTCTDADHPGVYSRVTKNVDWIHSVLTAYSGDGPTIGKRKFLEGGVYRVKITSYINFFI